MSAERDIETLETRAAELLGKWASSAVSVDHERGKGVTVRVWNQKGTDVVVEATERTAARAARVCLRKLKAKVSG